ncbi:MAG: hypothetical protein JSR55_04965 [Proteobacteria bacterium]|nr:hypothetical protein [Pseudomonadota bacterium]
MTLSDLASIGSLVSGVAVLASLVYLARQTQQNVRNSQALIQQGRAARIADTALRIAELRESEAIDKCFTGSPDVTDKDVARFLNICRAIYVSAEDSYFQHKQGLLDEIAFASFEHSVRAGMGAPGMAAGWILTRDMYEPEFRAYLDKLHGQDMHAPANSLQTRGVIRWRAVLETIHDGPAP